MVPLLAGLAVLVFVAAGCILGIRWIGSWFSNIDPELRLAIVAFSGIVLAPLISYVTTRAIETRKLAGQAAIERKIELYESFVARSNPEDAHLWLEQVHQGVAEDEQGLCTSGCGQCHRTPTDGSNRERIQGDPQRCRAQSVVAPERRHHVSDYLRHW